MEPLAEIVLPGADDGAGAPDAPFRGPGLLVKVAPFAAVAVLAEASLALQPGPPPVAEAVTSVVLLVVVAGAFLLPWERLPPWAPVLVPLAYSVSVLELVLATGPSAGVSSVILIPLLWTALFHRRWESGCVVVAIVAVEVIFSVVQDASASVIARRVILWAALGAMISVATHGLRLRISRSQAESTRLQDRIRNLTVLADRDRIARDLSEGVTRRILAAGTALHGTAALTRESEVRRRLEATVGDLDRAAGLLRQTIFDLGRGEDPGGSGDPGGREPGPAGQPVSPPGQG